MSFTQPEVEIQSVKRLSYKKNGLFYMKYCCTTATLIQRI